MEACGSAHHWGRLIAGFGHAVRLIPAVYAKQYVKRHKNEAATPRQLPKRLHV
jgi:transposase